MAAMGEDPKTSLTPSLALQAQKALAHHRLGAADDPDLRLVPDHEPRHAHASALARKSRSLRAVGDAVGTLLTLDRHLPNETGGYRERLITRAAD